MPKKHQQKSRCKARRTSLIVGVMLLATLFLISFSSATTITNSTKGFSTGDAGCNDPYGITKNTTNYLIADRIDKWVYCFDLTGTNLSCGFSSTIAFSNNPQKIAFKNETSIWLNLDNPNTLSEVSTSGVNITNTESNLDLAGAGFGNSILIDANNTDIWVGDNTNLWVDHYLYTGGAWVNQSDGFDINPDITDPYGLALVGGNNIYIVDGASLFVNHYTSGVNQSDGFDISSFGIGNPRAMTTDGTNLMVVDLTDDFMYYLNFGSDLSIDLTSPQDNDVLSDVGVDFIANYTTSSSHNLTNVTYYLWNTTGVFNNSEVIELNGTSNLTTQYIDNFILGDYEWNTYVCWGNATFDNCSFADNNFSFFVGASITNETYSNNTYETSKEEFDTNLTLLSGTTFYDAQLNYNGTLYEGTITDEGSNKYSITSTINIPLYTYSSFDWFWQLTYETASGFIYQNLSTHTQGISEINLTHIGCGTGANLSLNFTAYDEEDLTAISDYKFYGTFEYWLGDGSVKKNISLSDTNVSSNFSMCIFPNNLTYYSDAQIQYEKTNYVKRSYYLINTTLTNTTQNIRLYLLNTSSSTSFIINIIDEVQFAIEDAYIYIQRYYPGTGIFHTIEMAKTDNSGNTIGHFEAETEDYKIIVFKDGIILHESEKAKVFCGATPCTLNFQTSAADPTTWSDIGDLPNLIWSLVYDEILKIWTYTYVDISGTTNYGRLMVYIDDGSSRTIICNNSDTSSAATLTCNVTGYDGTIYAEAYLSRSPEILVWLESIIERSVKAIFGMEGLFWATIILLTIGMIGLWSPSIGVIMLLAGMVLINFLQLASFGLTTIMGIIIIGLILLWEIKK